MRKWLRSWFAWRFSLTRLVIAVLFLGASVGLNMREIGPVWLEGFHDPTYLWGWPLAFALRHGRPVSEVPFIDGDKREKWEVRYEAARRTARSYRLPCTHQTYRLLDWEYPVESAICSEPAFVFLAIDVLFALTVLSLILFLQIPRRKVVAKVE